MVGEHPSCTWKVTGSNPVSDTIFTPKTKNKMKTKETSCRKCGGNGKPSKALRNYHYIDKSYLRGETEFETKLLDCIKCESCGHSWIPETSPKQIYITVVTSGLTMLANKVARVLQPNEDIFDACSELAKEIAEENNLHWSNVLVQYFNHYSDEIPAMALKVPSKPNQKQFKQFDESLFKAYISKFSDEDKVNALAVLLDSFVKNYWVVSFDNRGISKFMKPTK